MEVTAMPTRFTEQSQRFRPNSNEEQVLQKAREHFEATLIGVQGELAGSVAAMEHRRADVPSLQRCRRVPPARQSVWPRSVPVLFAALVLRLSWGGNAGSVR